MEKKVYLIAKKHITLRMLANIGIKSKEDMPLERKAEIMTEAFINAGPLEVAASKEGSFFTKYDRIKYVKFIGTSFAFKREWFIIHRQKS
jgi:hypothetical protein